MMPDLKRSIARAQVSRVRILCALGFHSWTRWEVLDRPTFGPLVIRRCRRCDRIQPRYFD